MCCISKTVLHGEQSDICSKEQDTEKESHIQHTTDTNKQLTDSCILVNQRNVGYTILETSFIQFL